MITRSTPITVLIMTGTTIQPVVLMKRKNSPDQHTGKVKFSKSSSLLGECLDCWVMGIHPRISLITNNYPGRLSRCKQVYSRCRERGGNVPFPLVWRECHFQLLRPESLCIVRCQLFSSALFRALRTIT